MQIKYLERSKGADRSRPVLKHRAIKCVPAKEAQRTAPAAGHKGHDRLVDRRLIAAANNQQSGTAGEGSYIRIDLIKRIRSGALTRGNQAEILAGCAPATTLLSSSEKPRMIEDLKQTTLDFPLLCCSLSTRITGFHCTDGCGIITCSRLQCGELILTSRIL